MGFLPRTATKAEEEKGCSIPQGPSGPQPGSPASLPPSPHWPAAVTWPAHTADGRGQAQPPDAERAESRA